MITRQELFEEVKKGSKAKPGTKEFGLEACKLLYALHHSFFESQGLFLNEDKFKANQVVIKAVELFNKGSRKRWNVKGKERSFQKNKKWFSVTVDFSTEKDNLEMQSFEIGESQKRFNEVNRKLEEAKKICKSASSIDVLILATTQALRERESGKYSGVDVSEAIKDNEHLATEVRMFINDLKNQEAKAEENSE